MLLIRMQIFVGLGHMDKMARRIHENRKKVFLSPHN